MNIGGDKGGSSFKMNFQIVNKPSPNSVANTCIFAAFQAQDTITNLHVALDRPGRLSVEVCRKLKLEYLDKLRKFLGTIKFVCFSPVITSSCAECTES